ncbi:hypothetical protein GGX14DRAFT_397437 [Mycena pura]|uniref:Uncharacterized protein n=1 Tax=Mycena pura TaxID=153505 RepID=A0AAD6V196_9AGAR|nr:hypothetical protein GGX14DRAFT_401089 [Mycena pura]KAJ7205740.1 hypothetical protein GGX14DRAFT_397437 [Mycena pura]
MRRGLGAWPWKKPGLLLGVVHPAGGELEAAARVVAVSRMITQSHDKSPPLLLRYTLRQARPWLGFQSPKRTSSVSQTLPLPLLNMESPTSAEINVNVPRNPSTSITLTLNLRGNGPFNVNLNLNCTLPVEDTPASPLLQTPRRGVHRSAQTRRSARMTPYSRPSESPSHAQRLGLLSDRHTPRLLPSTTTRDDDLEVPETPQSQYELLCDALPGAASNQYGPPLPQFAASPAKSASSITESDSSIPEETYPDDTCFGMTDSQVDATVGSLLRACIEFNKQEEEEGSQE